MQEQVNRSQERRVAWGVNQHVLMHPRILVYYNSVRVRVRVGVRVRVRVGVKVRVRVRVGVGVRVRVGLESWLEWSIITPIKVYIRFGLRVA